MNYFNQGGQNSGRSATLASETRTCSDCAQYKRPPTGFAICKKKLMGVTADLLVTYKIEEGTCFEQKVK